MDCSGLSFIHLGQSNKLIYGCLPPCMLCIASKAVSLILSHCPPLGVGMVGVEEWTLPNAGRKPQDFFECVTIFSPSADPYLPQYLSGRLGQPLTVSLMHLFPSHIFPFKAPLAPLVVIFAYFSKGKYRTLSSLGLAPFEDVTTEA